MRDAIDPDRYDDLVPTGDRSRTTLLYLTAQTDDLARALWLFGLLTLLLVVFLLSMTLISVLRRRNRLRSERRRRRPEPNPWQEAGQRIEPYQSGRDR